MAQIGIMGIQDHLRIIHQQISKTARNAKALAKFIIAETQTGGQTDLHWYQRLNCIRSGYLSESTELYGSVDDDYLSDLTDRRVRQQINGEYSTVTANKLLFHHVLEKEFNSYLPDLFGVIDSKVVRSPTGNIRSESPAEWLNTQLKKHSKLVCKPSKSSGGGDSFYTLTRDGSDIYANDIQIEPTEFFGNLDDLYIVSEFIDQAPYSDEIFPDTTNTVRILTLRDPDSQQMFIPQAVHRFGTSNSFPVDNWDKGGLSTAIDLDTGQLGKSVQYTPGSSVSWYDKHPDSGGQIHGREVSHWKDTRETILKMSEKIQYMNIIGWDVVITPNGPVVLEGNSIPSIDMMQVHTPLLSDDRVRRFYQFHRNRQT